MTRVAVGGRQDQLDLNVISVLIVANLRFHRLTSVLIAVWRLRVSVLLNDQKKHGRCPHKTVGMQHFDKMRGI